MDNLAEDYYKWSPYNYSINNPIRFIDPDGNGIWDKVVEAGKAWVASKVRTAVENAVVATVEAGKEAAKDLVENTKIQTKAEVKVTEDYGAEVNIKGVGGAGYSKQVSEASITNENNFGLNGTYDGKTTGGDNKDVTDAYTAQAYGNGGFLKNTTKENGATSTELGVTTSTSIPLVQTETSVKLDNQGGMELSTGLAAGGKIPIVPLTPSLSTIHLSIGINFKLVYTKTSD